VAPISPSCDQGTVPDCIIKVQGQLKPQNGYSSIDPSEAKDYIHTEKRNKRAQYINHGIIFYHSKCSSKQARIYDTYKERGPFGLHLGVPNGLVEPSSCSVAWCSRTSFKRKAEYINHGILFYHYQCWAKQARIYDTYKERRPLGPQLGVPKGLVEPTSCTES